MICVVREIKVLVLCLRTYTFGNIINQRLHIFGSMNFPW
jgi:hypothetical protein